MKSNSRPQNKPATAIPPPLTPEETDALWRLVRDLLNTWLENPSDTTTKKEIGRIDVQLSVTPKAVYDWVAPLRAEISNISRLIESGDDVQIQAERERRQWVEENCDAERRERSRGLFLTIRRILEWCMIAVQEKKKMAARIHVKKAKAPKPTKPKKPTQLGF